ncbi:MAG: hypothetical protein NHG00_00880 [Candidatus Shikimatogenerans sp. JK-2022]|nr:hypothetical protein [Candidatus Shikimatogenerans bostrichidophilus]
MYEVINIPFLKITNNKKNKIIINKNFILSSKLFNNIIKNILYNNNRKFYNLKFFEISNCFYINKKKKLKEEKHIEILITKKKIKNIINYLYKVYNILIIILEKIGITNYIKKIKNNNKIIIKKDKKKIITLNIIINNNLKFNKIIYYVIIYIENIINILKYKKYIIYKKYSKYQYIKKDLTFIINKNIFYNDFYKITKNKLKKNLIKLKLFDIYTKNLPINKKSYTLRFIIKNKFGISKKYINIILNKLIKIYNIKLGAKLKN